MNAVMKAKMAQVWEDTKEQRAECKRIIAETEKLEEEYRAYVAGLFKFWLRSVEQYEFADCKAGQFVNDCIADDLGNDTMADLALFFLLDFVDWTRGMPRPLIGRFGSALDLERTVRDGYNKFSPYANTAFEDWPVHDWPNEGHGVFSGTVAEFLEGLYLDWFRHGGLYFSGTDYEELRNVK
jgi:hypothetical protein